VAEREARGGFLPPGESVLRVLGDRPEYFIPLDATVRSRRALAEMRRRLEDGTDG
jgi:hypothetical protein